MKSQPHPSPAARHIRLRLEGASASRFFPLLGEGVLIQGPGGATVERFLNQAAGISPNYLEDRVQTVFLDGRAVDDVHAAYVEDGATVALSAAMPGLAGAVLRRGGYYAAMRRQISYVGSGKTLTGGTVTATLKLFNLVARDLGPGLLKKGIRMPGGRFEDFIARQGRWLWNGCVAAEADGRPIEVEKIASRLNSDRQVVLIVEAS